jgi:hypothetical protein
MGAQFMGSQATEGTNASRLNLANNKTTGVSEATASGEVHAVAAVSTTAEGMTIESADPSKLWAAADTLRHADSRE